MHFKIPGETPPLRTTSLTTSNNMRNQTAIQIRSETPLNSYLSTCLSSMSDQFALHICGDIPLT